MKSTTYTLGFLDLASAASAAETHITAAEWAEPSQTNEPPHSSPTKISYETIWAHEISFRCYVAACPELSLILPWARVILHIVPAQPQRCVFGPPAKVSFRWKVGAGSEASRRRTALRRHSSVKRNYRCRLKSRHGAAVFCISYFRLGGYPFCDRAGVWDHLAQLQAWNPQLASDCSNLLLGDAYCVEKTGGDLD